MPGKLRPRQQRNAVEGKRRTSLPAPATLEAARRNHPEDFLLILRGIL